MNVGFPKQSCKETLTPRNFLDFQQTIFLILRSTLCSCSTYIPDIFHWYTYPFCQGNIWFHQSLYGLVRCRSWNRQQYNSMHRACHELKVKYKLFFSRNKPMFCVFKSIFCKSFFHGSAVKSAKICLIKIFDLFRYILQHLKQFDSVSVYILLLLSWWLTPRERLPVVVFPPERFLVEILTLKFSEIFFAVLTCLWQRNVKHLFYIFVYDVHTYISLKFKSRISKSHFSVTS